MAEKKPILTDGVYDVLNNIVKLGLPALGSLYFGLAQIWGLPGGEEVVGTLALLATFGGVLLTISKRQYDKSDAKFDGEVSHDGTVYLNSDALEKDAVLLKTPPSPPAG